jgi:lipopolysaccharide export system ATP-binding protein
VSTESERISLQTQGVSKSYKGRAVVREVNLSVAQGEVVGLLGPNGAGKTTTFYMIVGLTHPDSGSVLLGQHDITDLPMYMRAKNGISYLPQEASVFRKLSVEANIMAILETLPLSNKERRGRLEALLEEFGISHVRKSLADTLSGGERRRVEIARSLVISPKFILLDEPFSGIDPITVLEIQKIIAHLKSRHIGVLITDHNVRETLQVTDRAYIINNGSIFRSGTPQQLGTDSEVKRVYLGENFSLN